MIEIFISNKIVFIKYFSTMFIEIKSVIVHKKLGTI